MKSEKEIGRYCHKNNKPKQKCQKQNIYKTTLILFDEMKTKHKPNFLSPFYFDNSILIPKNQVCENHEKGFKSNGFNFTKN